MSFDDHLQLIPLFNERCIVIYNLIELRDHGLSVSTVDYRTWMKVQ
jgi:hypothetical protein